MELTTIDSILIAINSSSLYACITKTICVCVRSREITFGYTCLSGSHHGIPSLAHRERYNCLLEGEPVLADPPFESRCSTNKIARHYLQWFLRMKMVEEWRTNQDKYQGYIVDDLTTLGPQYQLSGQFSGDVGDLMLMTLSMCLACQSHQFPTC